MNMRLEAESLRGPLLKKAGEIRVQSDALAAQIKDIHDQWEGVVPPTVLPLVKKLQRERGLGRRITIGIDVFILEANNPLNYPPNS